MAQIFIILWFLFMFSGLIALAYGIYIIYYDAYGTFKKIKINYEGNKYKVIFKNYFLDECAHVYENGKKIGVRVPRWDFDRTTDFRFHALESIKYVISKNQMIEQSKIDFDKKIEQDKIDKINYLKKQKQKDDFYDSLRY